jgi:hypothetical protein
MLPSGETEGGKKGEKTEREGKEREHNNLECKQILSREKRSSRFLCL